MFKLGDRVITTNKVSSSIDVGFTGTIVDEGESVVSVEFDRKIKNGHSCGGNCEYGYGWNVLTKDLKLLKLEEVEYKVGDKVKCIAKDYDIKIGMTGKIVKIENKTIGISWDNYTDGHSCGGDCDCESGTGWWVNDYKVEKLESKEVIEYKVGDTVLIKDWDAMVKEFGLGFAGDIDGSPYFVKSMKKYCGMLLEITNIYVGYDSNDRYVLNHIDDYVFRDWMFEEVRIFPDELTIDDDVEPEEELYYQDTPYKDGKIVVDELYDPVERPEHYNQYRIEVIEIIEDATKGLEGIEAVCTGNALKYLLRFQYKDGKKDVRKAIWYLKRLLENMKEGNNENN